MSKLLDDPLTFIFVMLIGVVLFWVGAFYGASRVSDLMEKDWQKKMDAGLIRTFDEKSESYIWTKAEVKGKS